jgi:hypothetical protein
MSYRILLEKEPTLGSLKKYFFTESNFTFNTEAENFNYCGSGKSAIASILSYLRFKGILENKMSPILVPKWIGTEVYGVVTKYSFPTFDANSESKILIAYHQYGFPQDMDRILDFSQSKKMIVIEDCAHAVNSNYKGKRLGSIGDFSIYSFSKFVYCNVLGGIGFKDDEFNQFFNDLLSRSSKSLAAVINMIKLFSSYNINIENGKLVNTGFTNGLTSMAYSRYADSFLPLEGNINMFEKQFENESALRLKNYQYFKKMLIEYDAFEHLKENDIVPYAIPIKLPVPIMHRIIKKLRVIGVETGIYNFDIDRFMPEPNFIKTVLIPCHSNLSIAMIDSIIDIIVSEIRTQNS